MCNQCEKTCQTIEKLSAERNALIDRESAVRRAISLNHSQTREAYAVTGAKCEYVQHLAETLQEAVDRFESVPSAQNFRILSEANASFDTENETYIRLEREFVEAHARSVSVATDYLEVLDAISENSSAMHKTQKPFNAAMLKEYEKQIEKQDETNPVRELVN